MPGRDSTGDWDVYWRGTREGAAHEEGGAQDVALGEFWKRVFATRFAVRPPARVLDLASGNGAVTGFALRDAPDAELFASDYSRNALSDLQRRYPAVRCAVADAARPPFAEGSFDLVASQFGLEYAGLEALSAAARLVAGEGVLAALIHLREGVIHRECAHNLRAIVAIQGCEVLSLARAAFGAGFALNAGTGSVAAFRQAERAFTPAVRALERVLQQMGEAVAGGLAQRLYDDIAHMYQRMSAYEPQEVLQWLDGMEYELEAYRGRMASMLAVARDEASLRPVVAEIEGQGFTVLRMETLAMGPASQAGAWALELQRR